MPGHWIEVARHDAPAGLGATPRKHRDGRWYSSPDDKRTFRFVPGRIGLGDVSSIITQAQAVVSYFTQNPCTQNPVGVVSDFQTAYNGAGGAGSLTVDGQYGGNTQAALQEVLNAAPAAGGGGPTQTAPQNCFQGVVVNGTDYGAVPATPAPDTTVTNVLGQSVIPGSNGSTPVNWVPVYIGAGVAAVLGVVGYAVWAKRHHRR